MEKLMTAHEVAELVGRSSKWVYAQALQGSIPCVKLTDGTTRFIPKEIKEWIESKKYDSMYLGKT